MQTTNSQSMTGRTASFVAHTHTVHEPSQRALATRSWSSVKELSGSARSEATAKHFESFPPVLGSSCRR
jgi:hypothetical protein